MIEPVQSDQVTRTVIWGGSATTCGNAIEMSSLRAEHAGSIAIVIILHILHQITKIPVQVELWVDNAEVLSRRLMKEVPPMIMDYDLCQATIEWVNTIQFELQWRKVDSHVEDKRRQDPTKKFRGNPLAWRLNSAVDSLAGAQCASMTEGPLEIFFPPE